MFETPEEERTAMAKVMQNETTHPIIGKRVSTPDGDGFACGFDPGDDANPPLIAVRLDGDDGEQWFELGDVQRIRSGGYNPPYWSCA